MELTQAKINLIDKLIKNDRKFSNNEDLYDDFFNATCEKSVAIFNAIDSEQVLELYLKRVVTTAILNVLKESGRLRRTRAGFTPTKETIVASPSEIDYSSIVVDYASVKIPDTPEDFAIQKEMIDIIANSIIDIDKEFPKEDYLKIYNLRYDKGLTQKEIADELSLSQSEISKRLFTLMEKVRTVI